MTSVLSQSYTNWDMTVVIDSKDSMDSFSMATRIKASSNQKSKIHIFKSKYHGCPKVTDEGIFLSAYDICTILDSDDVLTQDSLSIINKAFTPDIGFAWTLYKLLDGKTLGYSKGVPNKYPDLSAAIKDGWWGAIHQRVFRKSLYKTTKGLSDKWSCAVDYQLMCLLVSTGCKTRFIPEVTYLYRRHRKGSLSLLYPDEQKKCEHEIRQAFRDGRLGA